MSWFDAMEQRKHDPVFRAQMRELLNEAHSDNHRGNSRPIEFWVDNETKLDLGYNRGGGRNDDDDDDDTHNRQQDKEEELLKEHRERLDELQKENERQTQLHHQQMQEQQRLLEIARKSNHEAQEKAEEARLEKERVQRECDKNILLNELELLYCNINGVHIPNIKRLNTEIQSKYNNEYILNYTELKKEDDRLKECHIDILNDASIQQFVLLGRTGDGKSTFGNRLCGDHSQYGDSGPFQTGLGVHSVTSQIKRHTMHNVKISIIDTPGIFDTNNNDNFHLNEVIEHLRGANGINAFIMCCRGGRLDIKYQEMLNDLQSMLTPEFWCNVILVVTYCQDQFAMHWNRTIKREYLQEITKKCNIRNNALKPYQIIGVNNNDRNSYSLCIQKVLNIVNDANKFNQRRFKSNKLISPIYRLKENTLCIQKNIKALISKRNSEKSDVSECKQKISDTINKCSSFQIDTKFANCITEVDHLLNGLANNNCILHDLSAIYCNNNQQQMDENDMKYQEQLSYDQLNIIQSQMERLEIAQQSHQILTYQTLKSKQFPSNINRTKLEQYLSDSEFLQVFNCTKSEFEQKPKWQQTELKKHFGLF